MAQIRFWAKNSCLRERSDAGNHRFCAASLCYTPPLILQDLGVFRSPNGMLYKTLSAAVYGIDASIIEVEVDVSGIR